MNDSPATVQNGNASEETSAAIKPPPEPNVEAVRRTRLDWFLGDVLEEEIEVAPELWEAMVEHARQFLAVSRGVTWERWAMLGAASRAAFLEAAGQLKIRSALEER